MDSGRLIDVIIEDRYGIHPDTKEELFIETVVYADKGYGDLIKGVDGVLDITYLFGVYHVCFDKRYDKEYVKREIEATIKCNPPAE